MGPISGPILLTNRWVAWDPGNFLPGWVGPPNVGARVDVYESILEKCVLVFLQQSHGLQEVLFTAFRKDSINWDEFLFFKGSGQSWARSQY